MSKNQVEENKTTGQTEGIIEVDVVKSDLKKALAAHKKFALQGKNVEASPLSWIRFKVEDEEMTICTTDGSRALSTKLALISNYGVNGEFCLSCELASKINLIKSDMDEIRIEANKERVEFIDYNFNSVQQLKVNSGTYPDFMQFFEQKKNFSITISKRLIKDIAALNTPTGMIDLYFDTKDTGASIFVKTKSDNISQQAILMPIVKKEDEKEG